MMRGRSPSRNATVNTLADADDSVHKSTLDPHLVRRIYVDLRIVDQAPLAGRADSNPDPGIMRARIRSILVDFGRFTPQELPYVVVRNSPVAGS